MGTYLLSATIKLAIRIDVCEMSLNANIKAHPGGYPTKPISFITQANFTVQTSKVSPEDFSIKTTHSLINTEHVYSANIETCSEKCNLKLRDLTRCIPTVQTSRNTLESCTVNKTSIQRVLSTDFTGIHRPKP